MLWTRAFWKAAFERSIATFAQTLGASIAGNAVGLISIHDWATYLYLAAIAALGSILLSVSAPERVAKPEPEPQQVVLAPSQDEVPAEVIAGPVEEITGR